jgi:hypothetical protein
MYTVLKQLENGEFVHVAFRDDLDQTVHLAQSLSAAWPGEYEVRDSHSKVLRIPLSATGEASPQTPA